MTKLSRLALAVVPGLFLSAVAGFSEVVVLRGGTVIQLKGPPLRQGRNVILTRADGTVLSVPATEIDVAATSAARAAQPAPAPPPAAAMPAQTLAEAARATREVPKAKVRITDADVSHNEAAQASAAAATSAEAPAGASDPGAGRIEVGEYSQEKSGDAIVVRGTLRNPGGTPAINVRMTVTALDSKGQAIATSEAGVSAGSIEPSKEAAFTVTLPVGGRGVSSLRFSPRWIAPEPARPAGSPQGAAAPAAAAPAGAAAPAPPARVSPPPAPAPTPYGRGSLYAPAAPNAPSQAPSDGRTGYIPGASHPSNQPKPPN